VIAQLGIGFAADSVLLKYSRDAERQADQMGVQIMYDAGLDPNGMVGMFERLQAESKGRAATFFSSHPSPENRIVGVKSEIVKVGGPPTGRRTDSAEFQQVKSTLMGMAAPTTSNRRNTDRTGRVTGRPDNPSSRVVDLRFDDLTLRHPDNWQNYQGQDGGITLAPDGGVANGSLAYGMIVDRFDSQTYRNQRVPTIEEATNQLLDELSRSNPNMRVVRENERIRVGGLRALSTELRNESPIGGRETDWLVTVLLPNGRLYYFIGVAPQNEFRVYQDAFNRVLSSVRFRNVSSN
jgi:predicted Zn-dependent protease